MMTKRQREERTKTHLMFSGTYRNLTGGEMDQSEISADLDLLHRYETTLSRINNNECEGHARMVTEYREGKKYQYGVEDLEWKARDERKATRIKNRVRDIADKYGLKVRFNNDPRGGAIRFILPDGRSNGWDGTTWGIYW